MTIEYFFEPLPAEETPAPHTHELSLTEKKEATCTEDGNIEYYTCSGCKKLFADKDAAKELTKDDIVISAPGHDWGEWITVKEATETEAGTAERTCSRCGEKETEELDKLTPAPEPSDEPLPGYTIVSGGSSEWTKGSGTPVTITVKRTDDDENCFSHFTGVQIDDAALDSDNYEARSGSTVVTISSAFLETLSTGAHTVSVLFDDGKAETEVTIKEADPTAAPTASPTASPGRKTPETGDTTRTGLWIGILAAAAAVLICLIILQKKKHRS